VLQLVLPALAAESRGVEAALEEREREDVVRLERFRARRARAGGGGA
jgi:V/A-type H+-transporting ATPase subunit D